MSKKKNEEILNSISSENLKRLAKEAMHINSFEREHKQWIIKNSIYRIKKI